MKLSWTSLKISIAGAKLNHLVLRDRIWDYGSMTEQARIIFYLVHKAKSSGIVESLKKQCTGSCFEKLKEQMKDLGMQEEVRYKRPSSRVTTEPQAGKNPVITEIAVIQVTQAKNSKPDTFTALINGYSRHEEHEFDIQRNKFSEEWSFVRQAEWWLLDRIK